MRAQPCTKELENYISSLGADGSDSAEVARRYGRLLAMCMEEWNPKAHKSSISYHLSKFVKR